MYALVQDLLQDNLSNEKMALLETFSKGRGIFGR